jgi:integrase
MKRRITMVARARDYLRLRRSLGFELEATEFVLLEFARFADRTEHHGPLTTELMLQWASRRGDHSPKYRAQRLSAVRSFARYLAAQDGQSEVPDQRLLGGVCRRQQPHIYSDSQLRQLLNGAADLAAVYPLRPKTYTTVFGLLASTGLRISEALGLHRTDVDLDAGILRIRQTKFHKSRLVPMHPTVTRALRHYATRRDGNVVGRSSLTFFVGGKGQPLSGSMVRHTFRRLCARLGLRSNGALPRPRIHDLRHTFACRRLLQWYRQGADVEHAIASLSTYMGHGKVTDTYWYLTGTGELLSIAGKRFEQFASSAVKGQTLLGRRES